MKQPAAVSSPLFESGGEFVLPDYLPKVQKVLRLEADVLPPARYMSGSEAQMSGNVLHTLLYLGGISAPYYHEEYDLLSPNYDEMRPRILKGTTDYDKL